MNDVKQKVHDYHLNSLVNAANHIIRDLACDLFDMRMAYSNLRADLAQKKECIDAMAETCAKDKKEIEELKAELARYRFWSSPADGRA